MRVLLQALGVVVAIALLVVSASMNWRFGFQLGTTEFDGHIYGAASVFLDCLKVLLPFFIAYAWIDGKKVRVIAGVMVWALLTGYSMTSAIGFSSSNRLEGAGVRLKEAKQVENAQDEIKRLNKKLASLDSHRAVSVVKADLDGVLSTSFRWKGRYRTLREITDDCKKVVGKGTKQSCERVTG